MLHSLCVIALGLDNTLIDPFRTLQEATNLLSKVPQSLADRLVLIGGQALLLWASHYLIDELTGLQSESLASDDLDLLGRAPEVTECARVWHGTAKLPEIDDHTPQSGIVMMNNNGVYDIVDFLPEVYGITQNEVLKYSDIMLFGDNKVRVLSPPLCLKSRIQNLYGLGYSEEKKQRELIRVISAISICRWYLIDLCNTRETARSVPNAITYITNNILMSNAAIAISAQFEIDLSEMYPMKIIESINADITDRFLAHRLRKYRQKVAAKRV